MNLPTLDGLKGAGDRLDARMANQERYLASIAANASRDRYLPELMTYAFAVKASGWGTNTAPNLLIPPKQNAIFVTGVWFGAVDAQSIAFGMGQSASDASFFPVASDVTGTPGLIPLAASGGSNMTMARPNWLFRIQPGMGLMAWLKNNNVEVDGYAQFFVGDLHTETPPDLTSQAAT